MTNPDEAWYKNAIIYAVDVRRFADGNGDGWGDFEGLTSRLDYLAELGVTCIWLLPFYPTPLRDNGYDIVNYYAVDPRVGTFDDFVRFVHAAGERSIRVMLDLVMDHTSDEHPWFVAARHDTQSRFRPYFIWADHPPPVSPDKGPIFPDEEKSVWTYDEISRSYYYHRFYHFEPSLNIGHPAVRDEIARALDFWLSFGISGFRIDAASHLVESKGVDDAERGDLHGVLRDIREIVSRRQPDLAILGEADVPAERLAAFFGDGDELNMLFNFMLNNYLFLAFAREEATPLVRGLSQLPAPPAAGQWANFIRNLDELDLERLPEADRALTLDTFAPDPSMRIYGRGIRRRLAPMLGGDRRRIELAFSLLFTLPGTPMFVYGDEIGMGEDLAQDGRSAVRAPMQWSADRNAGFSEADDARLVQPVIEDGPFGYREINVAAQRADPDSLLNWVRQLVHARRACPEFGYGTWRLFDLESPAVFGHRCLWKDGMVLAVHNLSGEPQTITLDLRDQRGRELDDLFGHAHHELLEEGTYQIHLEPYGYKWCRVRGERD